MLSCSCFPKVFRMPKAVLSVIATRPGGPEVLELVPRELPALKRGEMRVRVHAAGVNRP
ncbi:NAD(P)H-quinone oxidoreductase, partial [Helicobacter mehlei]